MYTKQKNIIDSFRHGFDISCSTVCNYIRF